MVICFFLWTKLIITSILLIIIIESFTTCYSVTKLEQLVSKDIYKILKLSYFFILPIVISIFIRTFFIDLYFVPSKSMERTLFPDDYVVVNKFSYGVKLPKHLRNIPVVGSLFQAPSNEFDLYHSLKGLEEFKREDIVVFKAVDDSDKFFIKRIIGMPSDTLEIQNGIVIINNKELPNRDSFSFDYIGNEVKNVTIIKNFSEKEFRESSLKDKSIFIKNIRKEPDFSYFLFPRNKQEIWSIDNYGSLIVPHKGFKIELTKENKEIYESIISKFENIDLESYPQEFYTFTKDYYFMLGDNRHDSIDSRSYGFVPEDYIQGKMIRVF
ncbi:signal peptidase I [Tenacibaculum sp. 190524A05c]|uniref:signal peptidase I n=1 Tax=Tenacibaculum platacis TaxID=3137852 RepID=UPI0032B0F233